MPVSAGINGTVNGRSASSPAVKSAMNINSFPAKQNKANKWRDFYLKLVDKLLIFTLVVHIKAIV